MNILGIYLSPWVSILETEPASQAVLCYSDAIVSLRLVEIGDDTGLVQEEERCMACIWDLWNLLLQAACSSAMTKAVVAFFLLYAYYTSPSQNVYLLDFYCFIRPKE